MDLTGLGVAISSVYGLGTYEERYLIGLAYPCDDRVTGSLSGRNSAHRGSEVGVTCSCGRAEGKFNLRDIGAAYHESVVGIEAEYFATINLRSGCAGGFLDIDGIAFEFSFTGNEEVGGGNCMRNAGSVGFDRINGHVGNIRRCRLAEEHIFCGILETGATAIFHHVAFEEHIATEIGGVEGEAQCVAYVTNRELYADALAEVGAG